jgi:hypothetical protein
MKKGKALKPLSERNFTNDFVRGTLAGGIVAAIAQNGRPRLDRVAARRVLQGGVVLAAATAAADALQQRRYLYALLATAGAAASTWALQRLLPDEP